jgi:tetratricopeptide (TPR) repeat protein
MTEQPRRTIRAIRDFLLSAFDADELKGLLYFADEPDLRDAEGEFLPRESLPVWVDKAVEYCERHDLLDQLLAEIERARPAQFHRLREKLRAAAALVLSLPTDLADFTGREADVEQTCRLLDRTGAVLISGMGGVGKTALAVRVARQMAGEGRFGDARLYLDLKGSDPAPVEPVDALESLLNAMDKPDPNRTRTLDKLTDLWCETICAKGALLILDNAADAEQVRALLPGCAARAECAVLVTSRQRFTLPGLRRLDLDPLQPEKARDLLQDLAPHLDDSGADRMAELCGGLPLALRVAGNYLNLNDDETVDEYARKLASERTRLGQFRDPYDKDLDVAAVLSLSVARLARDDADLCRGWALLSLFTAPFDPPAAAALWGQLWVSEGPDSEPMDNNVLGLLREMLAGGDGLARRDAKECLHGLRDRSLLTYDRDAERWLLHDLVRLAAMGSCGGLDEQEINSAQLRLAGHFLRVAYGAKALFTQGGGGVLEGLSVFDRDWSHIRAGQAWAAAHATIDDEAAHLCNDYPDAASHLLALRLSPREWIGWLKPALDAARRVGDQEGEANHLGSLGLAYKNLGEMEKAIDYYQQALTLAHHIGDRRGEATHLRNLGGVYQILGETHQAVALFQQALDIVIELEDRTAVGELQASLRLADKTLRETEQAIDQLQQTLQLHRNAGDRLYEGRDLGYLGSAYHRLGETEKAIDYLEQSLKIAREIGDRRGEAEDLANLGLICSQQGDVARARQHATEALALLVSLEDPRAEQIRAWLALLGQ